MRAFFARAFPVSYDRNGLFADDIQPFSIKEAPNDDLADISANFNKRNNLRPFQNAGIMIGGQVWSTKVEPGYHGACAVLGDILAAGDDRV